jgi:hypothetical protein
MSVTSRDIHDILIAGPISGSDFCSKWFGSQQKWMLPDRKFDANDGGIEDREGSKMISTWSEWKRYPRAGRGENIEAPITPGIYEVRFAGNGALHSFGAVDNVAQALSMLTVGTKSWFGRREPATPLDLEYRTCATSTKADAKAAAERMIGRRETYMSGAA